MYIKNPEGSIFWVLNAALYGLREVARNWYNRFQALCLSLEFTPAPGDPTAYSYDRDGWGSSALTIHVDDALTCGNNLFYDSVIVPLLSQFSISMIDLQCYVNASYNQLTESGIKFNVRGSISGLMCRNDTFSPVQ